MLLHGSHAILSVCSTLKRLLHIPTTCLLLRHFKQRLKISHHTYGAVPNRSHLIEMRSGEINNQCKMCTVHRRKTPDQRSQTKRSSMLLVQQVRKSRHNSRPSLLTHSTALCCEAHRLRQPDVSHRQRLMASSAAVCRSEAHRLRQPDVSHRQCLVATRGNCAPLLSCCVP